MVSIIHGMLRMTMDVDIVADIDWRYDGAGCFFS